jgi:predicted metal-dependent HD superfamily phosphohydrolase
VESGSPLNDEARRHWPAFVNEMLVRLSRELAPDLCYHSYHHTEIVIADTLALAQAEQLNDRDRLLLLIAASFHDAGFLRDREQHERCGASMAIEAMRVAGGFESAEIALVETCILDTRIDPSQPQLRQPRARISPVLLDADMANLGRPDFADKTELIRRERKLHAGPQFDEWVYDMLLRHIWYTPSADKQWRSGKDRNIEQLRLRLG